MMRAQHAGRLPGAALRVTLGGGSGSARSAATSANAASARVGVRGCS
jgi:hypothetical protein